MEFNIKDALFLKTDVLILGSGAAGCGAALSARKAGADVLLVDKGKLESSGCLGGGNDHFQAVLNTNEPNDKSDDFIKSRISPTLGATQAHVEAWAETMPKMVELLENIGVCLLKNEDGSYLRTGGFGEPGKWYINIGQGYFCKPLLAKAIRESGVRVLDHVMITSLIKKGGVVTGAIGYNVRECSLVVISAKSVVMAMGNFANRAVANSTGNPFNTWHSPFNTGSQFVLAYRAGARLLNLDLLQNVTYVPKSFGCAGMNGITEAGAYALNAHGDRFMPRYHPGGELSPRHFQIRGASLEQSKGDGPPFFMDLRHVPADKLEHLDKTLMPGDKATWLDYAEQKKLDLSNKPLEVEFSEIEFGGLIETRNDFSTHVPGMYNACVFYGFSGALCGGWNAGEAAAAGALTSALSEWPDEDELINQRDFIFAPLNVENGIPQTLFERTIRQIMSYYMGLVRNEHGMRIAVEKLEFVAKHKEKVSASTPHELLRAHEAFMLLEISRLATLVSLERRETGRATWRRSDYPNPDPDLNHVLAIKKDKGHDKVMMS